MNLRIFLIPIVFLGVCVTVALVAADPGARVSWVQLSVGGTIALTMLLGVFETVRSTASRARQVSLLSLSVPSALPLARHDATAEAVLALSRDDAQFSSARVQAHVEALFRTMQRAHRERTLDLVHPWVSDGLFQRLSTQARLFGGVVGHELLEGHAVQGAVVSGAGVGEAYRSLAVRVTVAPLAGEQAHAAQTQTWRFLRRRSATTQAHGLFDGCCPNCGAPLRLSATQRCAHCEAVVNSGEHDWVLVDMAPGALTLSPKADLLDLDGVRAADTALAPEELVDRATLAFWRWYEAGASGDTRRLARVATEAFLTAVGAPLSARPLAGLRPTVGGAELRLLRVREGSTEAAVVLWWSSADGAAEQTVLTLVRPSERTGAAQAAGLATFRCEGCLAPMTDTESPACEHCGRPFADAWRLQTMEPFAAWADTVRALRRELGPRAGGWQTVPRHERLHALQLAAAVVKADGRVVDAERALLERLTSEWSLSAEDLAAALASAGPASAAGLALPRDFARELTRQLVDLVFVDGRAELAERKLVERLASSLGTQAEAQKLIASRVDALLKQHAAR